MPNSDTPICVAVVICNDVIEDKRTSNKSLIGLFNAINAPQLPVTHPRMNVLASLTNAKADVPISLQITAPSGTEVMRAEGTVPMNDPLAVVDVVFEVNGLPVEELGTYMIDLFTGSHHLGGRRFQVIAGWKQ